MDEIAVKEIKAYFRIDRRIKRTEKRIADAREAFYNRTFSTRMESDVLGFYVVSERMDGVVNLLDTVRDFEQSIEILKLKKRYLNGFLITLPVADRQYLIEKYSKEDLSIYATGLDWQLYEEVLEINEAINYIYGFPQDSRPVAGNNNNLEDEFSSILEALEV